MLNGVEGALVVFCFGALFLSLEVFELPYVMALIGAQIAALTSAHHRRRGDEHGKDGLPHFRSRSAHDRTARTRADCASDSCFTSCRSPAPRSSSPRPSAAWGRESIQSSSASTTSASSASDCGRRPPGRRSRPASGTRPRTWRAAWPGEIQAPQLEIVHAHQYTPFFYAALARPLVRHPIHVMFTEHGRHYPDVVSWKRRLANRLVLGRLADEIHGVCQFSADSLATDDGFVARPIR